jgi:hypothetical protein
MHSTKLRLAVIAAFICLLVPFASYGQTGIITSAVQGTAANGTSFVGSLTVTGFNVVNNAIVATGTLSGSILNKAGGVIGTVTQQAVQVPLASANGTCTVLTLTLGPLDLHLLGLQVHLNQVVLTITANPAGGILGQLLCSLAGGLNLGGTLQQIVGLLNQILAAL